VIHHREIGRVAPQRPTRDLQALKCLWACNFMDKVPININKTGPVLLLVNNVFIPEFVVQGASGHGDFLQ
jgi:hypothetical protein